MGGGRMVHAQSISASKRRFGPRAASQLRMERSDSPFLAGYELPPEAQLPAGAPAAGTARTMNRCGAGPT
jgi:hypothetical protein